jgi:tetratricopeptide (TPR) repeat protein
LHSIEAMTRILYTLVLGLLCWTAPARAEQAETLLQEARTRRAAAEFNEAIELLERARQATDDPALLARIHLALGVTHATLGQTSAAEAAFRQALTFDPLLDADPRRIKSATVELFRRIRQGLEGDLEVTSACPGAEVFVDGQQLGVVPYRGRRPIGRCQVRVRCDDDLQYAETVIVAVDQMTTVQARFAASVGAPSPDPPAPARSRFRPWAWGTAAAAVAAMGLSLGFGLAAKSDHDAWSAENEDPVRWDELKDSGRSKALTANISLGIGAALAATSIVLFVLDRRERAGSSSGGTARATARGAMLSLEWP